MKFRSNNFILISSHPQSIDDFRGDLITALQECGVIVHVVSLKINKSNDIYKDLKTMGVVIHQIPFNRKGINPFFDFVFLLRLVSLFISIKPKYVMGYTVKPVIYGSVAAMICRVPYNFSLITGLGSFFGEGLSKSHAIIHKILKALYRIALSGSNTIFFQNPDDCKLFLKNKIIKSLDKTVIVNGSGVNLEYYYKSQFPSKVSFLLISRLISEKGILEFASAAHEISSKYTNVKFALAGWYDNDSISKDTVDSWVEDGRLVFLGELEDVRSAIENCSVFVLPSFYREGVPRVILEAMSMGKAIITTDSPGCRETVIDNESGYLIKPKSTNELISAMLKFVKNEDLIDKMGKRSRQLAEDKFDVHKVNEVMLKGMGLSKL